MKLSQMNMKSEADSIICYCYKFHSANFFARLLYNKGNVVEVLRLVL